MQTTTSIDRGLFLLRIALGSVFVMHGWQKLAVLGHSGVAGFLGQLGVPFPAVGAALLVAVELGGGLALLAGAFTRVAGLLIAGAMLVATVTVHLPNGYFLPNGYEFTLTLLMASLAVTMTGAGAYSVDRWLSRSGRLAAMPVPASRERLAA
jgi:putative oxidoreductase